MGMQLQGLGRLTFLPFQPYIYIITYTLNLLKQIGFEDDEIAKFGICPSSSAEN
jgi:hypothetical protein